MNVKVVDNWAQRASMNAAAAIRLESIGRKAAAIEHYRRVIDALDKLVNIYPDFNISRVYRERARRSRTGLRSLK